jgi:hypothetical protein
MYVCLRARCAVGVLTYSRSMQPRCFLYDVPFPHSCVLFSCWCKVHAGGIIYMLRSLVHIYTIHTATFHTHWVNDVFTYSHTCIHIYIHTHAAIHACMRLICMCTFHSCICFHWCESALVRCNQSGTNRPTCTP